MLKIAFLQKIVIARDFWLNKMQPSKIDVGGDGKQLIY